MRLAVAVEEDLEVLEEVADAWFLRGFFRRASSVGLAEDDDLEVVLEDGIEDADPARAWKSLYLLFSLSNGLTCFLMPLR